VQLFELPGGVGHLFSFVFVVVVVGVWFWRVIPRRSDFRSRRSVVVVSVTFLVFVICFILLTFACAGG